MADCCLATLSSVLAGAPAQDRDDAGSRSTPMALVGGTLIDGTGGPPIPNSVILIRGERIERVGTTATLPVPEGYERVSTEGMSVLPGLWDLHVHLICAGHPNLGEWLDTYDVSRLERDIMPAMAEQFPLSGVTSVRDLGAPLEILNVKTRIANGEIPGPTV